MSAQSYRGLHQALLRPAMSTAALTSAACGGMLVFGMVVALLGALLPLLSARLHVELAQAGTLFLTMNFAMLVTMLALGPLTDRFGKKLPLAGGAAMAALALLVLAGAGDYGTLLVAAVMVGAGGGALNGATNTLIADLHTDPRRKSSALNWLGVFFGVGALLLPFVIGSLLETLGLARILQLGAAFSLTLSVVCLVLRFPPPRRAAGLPLKEVARLARRPLVLLFGFLLFFESGAEFVLGGYTSVYLTGELHLPISLASYLLAALWGSIMLARVVSSRLLLRVSGPALVLAGVLGTAVGIAVLLAAHDGQMAALGVVLIGLSAASIYPTVLGQAGSRFEEHSGTVFGILFSIALAGGMTLPWLVGRLAQAYGLRRALLVSLAATLLVGGFQALIARKTGTGSTIPF